MVALVAAALTLVAGALFALVLPANRLRASAAIAAQAVACALTLFACAGPLLHGADIDATWQLGFPLDEVGTHVDALSAFFLAWSLPMMLLGSIYAWSYLQPWLRAGRNAGPHFALLNTIALSFLIVYSAQNALVFLLGWELAAVGA
jgi:hydrogenase-4 component B